MACPWAGPGRSLRERADRTPGTRPGRRAPSISRWENGERSVRPADLRLLLDIYDVHGDQRDALLTLARQARERGWWQSYASAIPEWFQVYLGLEAEASLVREYAAELVPGLLQTAGYGAAFLHAPPAPAAEDELARRATVRMGRQERLTGEDPPEYWAVLNEAVIRRPVGGPQVRPVAYTWNSPPRPTTTPGCSATWSPRL